MARVVVFGAAGKAGRLFVEEAARRGHQVTAVVRDPKNVANFPPGVTVRQGDATSAQSVRELAPDADVFIVAIGSPDNTGWNRAAQTMIETLSGMPGPVPRVIHMGGGSTLLTPDGKRFIDLPQFPAEYRASALGQAEALDTYRKSNRSTVRWTYVSPPPIHFAPGQRTGKYRTGLDHPVVDDHGESSLSYEDFAIAVLDEIERPHFVNQRFTVGY